jgi:membrane-bound ClpP family serine protease
MTAFGIVLLLLGVVLVVAEAHVPGGVLGVLGAVALIAGLAVVATGAGIEAAVAVPVGAAIGLAAGGWALLAARSVARTRRAVVRPSSRGGVPVFSRPCPRPISRICPARARDARSP